MNVIVKTLFRIGLLIDFGKATPFLKISAAYIRYYSAILVRNYFYKKKEIILICGLPKSGTTWLENLISFKGMYKNLMPPEFVIWEQKYGRSDSFVPQYDFIEKIPNGKWIIKVHAKYSKKLWQIIEKNNLKPIVIYRNIDEVLDSHNHYISNTYFHPDFQLTKEMTQDEKINYFKKKYFDDFKKWISCWKKLDDKVHLLTYNQLLNNTSFEVKKILDFLDKNYTEDQINSTVDFSSLENLKKRSIQKVFFRGERLKNK